MKKLRILFAEDHTLVRNGIKLMLEQQRAFIPVITEAEDGDQVINLASEFTFDLILLDINLPKKNGIIITKTLIKQNPSVKILALTMHNEEFIIHQIISAGALGYLLKSTGIDELTRAVVTVASGNKYFCNEASQILINKTIKEKPSSKLLSFDVDSLSKREKEVMQYIVKEYSSSQIAEKLFISKRTVDGHRKSILTKLNLKNTAGIVKYAIQNGFNEEIN